MTSKTLHVPSEVVFGTPPIKAEPQEVFGDPHTDPHKAVGRLGVLHGSTLRGAVARSTYGRMSRAGIAGIKGDRISGVKYHPLRNTP